MLAVGGRLVYLQIAQHDWLTVKAHAQQNGAIETSPIRGLILDRQGRELARSVDTDSFFAVPSEINDVSKTATLIASAVRLDADLLTAGVRKAQDEGRKFAWLARKLDPKEADAVRALKLDGVYSHKEPKRFYPNSQLAAHVLGFVGLDETGLGGIEQSFNEKIHGEAGKVFFETDAKRHPFESSEAPSRAGQTIILTIDEVIQHRAEQVLSAAVTNTHAKSGTAIVLDPRTGEILALANAPAFDPNNATAASRQARVNGALENIYEPGSTFKIVAYSAAIEMGLVKPDDRIDCQMGSIMVAGRLVHDHHPFGTLTIADALAKSSNVAAIKLGIRVGDASMYDYITRFGFGSRTGVELPGEAFGLVRPVHKWSPSSIGSIAMGQEVGVTPLQMVAAFGAIANGGLRLAPHLVREIRGTDGAISFRSAPEQRMVLKPETAAALRGMLEDVTLKGTAKRAQLDGYTAAGKTGTAQKIVGKSYSRTKYIGSFVGFAPVENPAVVIIVVIDEPVGSYHGGDVAAPVFRDIAEQILPDMDVAPDTQLKSSPQMIARNLRDQRDIDSRQGDATLPRSAQDTDSSSNEVIYAAATDHSMLMPDLHNRSLREAVQVCTRLDLRLEAHGDGRARRQTPEAGAEVGPGQLVHVEFARD
jgi:cell division protein FtsI (penicillin-binding protein 3)